MMSYDPIIFQSLPQYLLIDGTKKPDGQFLIAAALIPGKQNRVYENVQTIPYNPLTVFAFLQEVFADIMQPVSLVLDLPKEIMVNMKLDIPENFHLICNTPYRVPARSKVESLLRAGKEKKINEDYRHLASMVFPKYGISFPIK
jgi:hypothetical protein